MARILVIDDELHIREMLAKLLTRHGHEVLTAEDGRQGIQLHSKQPVDLVITDIIMPEVEGMEVIRVFKHNFSTVPIIAISGGGRIEPYTYLKMAEELGATRTFKKPFETKELIQTIKELLNHSTE
ncbi:MAG: response regulator [Desulfobacterales bacterium]|nr:response regulator [Desulfobacterales bacterium]